MPSVGLPFDWHRIPISLEEQRAADSRQRFSTAPISPEIGESSSHSSEENDHLAPLPIINPRDSAFMRHSRSLDIPPGRASRTFDFHRSTSISRPSFQEDLSQWIPEWMSRISNYWMTPITRQDSAV